MHEDVIIGKLFELNNSVYNSPDSRQYAKRASPIQFGSALPSWQRPRSRINTASYSELPELLLVVLEGAVAF